MLCMSYGLEPPRNLLDKWVTMSSMLTGAFMYAMVVGSVAAHYSSSEGSRQMYNRMTDCVTDWLREHDIDTELASRVRGYFQHRYPRQVQSSAGASGAPA